MAVLTSPDERALFAELVDGGLLSRREIVAGEVVIRERGGRHGGLAVERSAGASWFLKRDGSSVDSALRHEAEVLGHLSRRPHPADFAPRVHSFDAGRDALVTSLIPGASLREAAMTEHGVPIPLAAEVGLALGALHRSERGCEGPDLESSEITWALSMHRPRPSDLTWLSTASLELVRLLQQQSGTCARIDEVRDGWRAETLIHGDLRWDNVIWRRGSGGPQGGISLVDWESGGVGDPAWDVGSVLGQLVSDWVLATLRRPDGPSQGPAHEHGDELRRLHSRAAAFWAAYLDSASPEEPAGELRARAVRCAGVRLLQFGVEIAQSSLAPSRGSLSHMQVGANVLDEPEGTASILLALGLDSA